MAKKKRKHRTAYQKSTAALDKEGRDQCFLIYSATALALYRHWGKGKQAILNLFQVSNEIFHTCASTNARSMVEMCERETGIELQCGNGKSWEDLPYLNSDIDTGPLTYAQWTYMRQRQKQWVAPQAMAGVMIALHRKYGFGYDRCSRIYQQIRDIEAEYGMDPDRLQKACREETKINIYDIVMKPIGEEEKVV